MEIGRFRGEYWRTREPHTVNLEFRSGEHRISYLRWKLFDGGEVVPDKPIKLSQHPQLLFDNHLVEEYRDLKRTIHQPEMHSNNPVFAWKEPCEYGAVLLWGTVIYDEQEDLFKMWYMSWGNDAGGALPGYRTPVCYATSADGIRWHRPRFGHCPFRMRDLKNPHGQRLEFPRNNIVFNLPESADGMDSPTVVKDLREADPKRRYKMSYWHRLPTGTGIYHAFSPDGIHWTHIPKMVADTGDRNTFHWDPFRGKWVTSPQRRLRLILLGMTHGRSGVGRIKNQSHTAPAMG